MVDENPVVHEFRFSRGKWAWARVHADGAVTGLDEQRRPLDSFPATDFSREVARLAIELKKREA